MEQRVIEDPVLKHRLSFEPPRTAAVRVEMWVDPGGGVPPHVHPAMEERFEVVSGQPELPGRPQVADGRAGRDGGAGARRAARLPQPGRRGRPT